MAIPLPTGFRAGYRAERAAATPRKPRTPVLTHAGRAAARLANVAARARTTALALGGFGFLDYAAFRVDEIAGWAAVGATLLLVEWLVSDGTSGDGGS